MFNVIPAIDLLDQKVVRLKQGDYNEVTFYKQSPLELAKGFEQAGATRLHIVDLNGARDGSVIHGNIIQSIRSETNLEIEVGGGIRTKESAQFYIDLGVNYIIIGSLFIKNFDLAASFASDFPQHVIAGVDARDDYIATDGWESTSSYALPDFIKILNTLPLSSIVYTDISRDGMMSGPNLVRLSEVAQLSSHPVIASGGVRHHQDIQQLSEIKNLLGCIIGKAILSGTLDYKTLFSSAE